MKRCLYIFVVEDLSYRLIEVIDLVVEGIFNFINVDGSLLFEDIKVERNVDLD